MHTLKHRTLALIMSLIMILSCFAGMTFSVGAYNIYGEYNTYTEYTSGDYKFKVLKEDRTLSITEYIGSSTDVVIPSSIVGMTVTEIAWGAFEENDKIISVTIPNTVCTIGDYVFEECKLLKTVIIPSGVTKIGYAVFRDCLNLESADIPDSVTTLGKSVFSGCVHLKTVKLSKNITQIPYGFFSGCKSLTSIEIPSGVVTIGESSFSGCEKIIDIAIPNTVTTIEGYAFSGCSALKSITIPESVTVIDEDIFGYISRYDKPNFVIKGAKGSVAEEFANSNGISFCDMYCKHENAEIRGGTEPTCTTPGQTGTKYCPTCKMTLSESEEIPALGHTEEKIPAKPAACTEKGLTEGVKCAVCGEILTEQKEIPELGHYFENGKCTRCSEDDPSYKLTLSSDSKLILSEEKAMIFGIPESTGGMTAGDFKSQISNKINIGIDDSAIITNGLKFSLGNTEYSIILKGDANADGKITASDARTILRIAAKLENPDDVTKESADINSDGKVTSSEARSVLRFAAKLDGKLTG